MSDLNYFEEEEFDAQFNGRTILRIIGQARPHWKFMVTFLLAISGVAFLDSVFTFLSKRIIDEGIVARDPQALLQLIAIYGALSLLAALLVFTFIFTAGGLGEKIQFDLREKMFARLQDLELAYYDRTPLGWIMSRVTSDSQRIAELVSWGILDIFWGITSITSSMIFMLYINWKLALIVFTIIPVLIVVAAVFKKYILVEYRKVRKLNSKITGAYNENISGVRVSKALGRERENLDEFQTLTGDMYRSGFRAAWLSALFLPMVQLISAMGIASIAWYGGIQSTMGGITIGGIQAFISYITFMLWPVQEMARVYADLQRSVASAERVFSLIDSTPGIVDRKGALDPESLRGEIEFDRVDFFYEEDKPVLSDFSLKVRAGETIAIVGPTGAGKSTIVNLVGRFYEPKHGAIRIGGRDYTEYTLAGLQSRLGVMLQTPHLFSGTIRENIRYGRLKANDEDVETAARLAGAHDFIIELENGYEEEVGEGGVLLSVGQKQLISLARAILADPDIFIMDEATSSIDTLTEARIQQGMERILKGRTSFVIAHRLSTIKRADRILVLDEGKITEQGSHAELIKQKGHYFRLYTQQFRRDLETRYTLLEDQPAAAD